MTHETPQSDISTLSREELLKEFGETRNTDFEGGVAKYTLVGQYNPTRNRYLIIPGFAGSLPSLRDFAIELSAGGTEQVITAGQPKIIAPPEEGVIEAHARGIIAIIEAENLAHEPLDAVTHSMGWMTLEKAAALAREKGYKCFDIESGAHSYAIAPAGFIPDENIVKMGSRWTQFIQHDMKAQRRHPDGKEIGNANMVEIVTQPRKTIKEVAELASSRTDFEKLGAVGLKPFVFVFGNDIMFPYEGGKGAIGKTIELNAGIADEDIEPSITGVASPVDSNIVTLPSKQAFKEHLAATEPKATTARERLKRRLRIRKRAEDAWADSNNNSGHGDLSYHAARLAGAVQQVRDQQYKQ